MKPVKLSVSSLKTLQSCEAKYHHYKVAETPKDQDYQESEAANLGKAFHQVMELTKHKSWNMELLKKAMADHNVDPEEEMLLRVMLQKYVAYHAASGLEVVYCELGIETNVTVLYIDAVAIAKDATGKPYGWWIVDLKTAGRHDENLLPQLARDLQMNHYAAFADDVEVGVPEVAGLKFLGCRYRQIIKSKAGTLGGLEKGVKVFDIEIPAHALRVEETKSLFNHIHDRAVQLHQGEAPTKNYSACFNYFSPCQYFSKCHGELFTKNHNKVTVHTMESLTNGDLL
jgi:hypothetical protein